MIITNNINSARSIHSSCVIHKYQVGLAHSIRETLAKPFGSLVSVFLLVHSTDTYSNHHISLT